MSEIEASDTSAVPPQQSAIMIRITDGKNPRGIPTARFIDDVVDFLGEDSPELILGALNELYSKYKYMEKSFDQSKSIYKAKIPELQQTIDMVEVLSKKREHAEEVTVNYALCDTIFAKAKVQTEQGKLCLWIGASTMVEYTYEEALEMLGTQLVQCHAKIEELNEDLYHLRGNSITVEVNMARIFNHSVKLKKLASSTPASGGEVSK